MVTNIKCRKIGKVISDNEILYSWIIIFLPVAFLLITKVSRFPRKSDKVLLCAHSAQDKHFFDASYRP